MSERKKVWYVRTLTEGIEEHDSEDAAKTSADAWMETYGEWANEEGWDADIEYVEWGELVPREAVEIKRTPAWPGTTCQGCPVEEYWDVKLVPVSSPKRLDEVGREGGEGG